MGPGDFKTPVFEGAETGPAESVLLAPEPSAVTTHQAHVGPLVDASASPPRCHLPVECDNVHFNKLPSDNWPGIAPAFFF